MERIEKPKQVSKIINGTVTNHNGTKTDLKGIVTNHNGIVTDLVASEVSVVGRRKGQFTMRYKYQCIGITNYIHVR